MQPEPGEFSQCCEHGPDLRRRHVECLIVDPGGKDLAVFDDKHVDPVLVQKTRCKELDREG